MVERPAWTLNAVYGAISHPLRRAVLERLAVSPARVTDVAEPFETSLAAVSKHIHVLEQAGLVHRSIEGREHRLALEASPLATAADWLAPYRQFWEERLSRLESRLHTERWT